MITISKKKGLLLIALFFVFGLCAGASTMTFHNRQEFREGGRGGWEQRGGMMGDRNGFNPRQGYGPQGYGPQMMQYPTNTQTPAPTAPQETPTTTAPKAVTQ